MIKADKEREEQRRQVEQSLGHLGQQFLRDDSSLTNSYSSSIDDYPAFSRDSSVDSNNTETLRRLLEQVIIVFLRRYHLSVKCHSGAHSKIHVWQPFQISSRGQMMIETLATSKRMKWKYINKKIFIFF